ncbi:hypothetical protein [Natronomonas gomsonensis]|uniref:hypothetical protein n=1 Tax=Natronomonas gomsonensis TaxID=1046043 RepID=UPI0015C10C9F|nr:hypothetical protein [Natronomonas gomsonensis]
MDDDDPFRIVGLVVAAFAAVFVAILLLVQFGGNAGGVVTLPAFLAVPVVAVGIYLLVKNR